MSCEGILWLSQGNLPNRPQAAAISSTFLLLFGQIVRRSLAIRAFWRFPAAEEAEEKARCGISADPARWVKILVNSPFDGLRA